MTLRLPGLPQLLHLLRLPLASVGRSSAGSGSAPEIQMGTRKGGLLGRRVPVRLSERHLASHLHVMGTTGVGKSKLLAHLATELIRAGRACAVLDPHADLADDILTLLLDRGFYRHHPDEVMRRVLYVDFGNPHAFIPFNILRAPSYRPPEIARHLVEACTRAWPALADGSAPQFENLLLASAVVLIENGLPLTAMTQLLTDASYREQLLEQVSDPEVVAFFRLRYARWGKEAPLMIESTLRRIFLLSFTPALRYSLGQADNALDFRRLMDEGVSIICNLGGLDEQTQKMLGCLVSVGFEVAALSREDTPERERRPYHLIMDEFSMFSAQSEEALTRVLATARKYHLFLVMANQTWSQLSARLQGSLQNALPIYFRLGYDDAVWAAPRFSQADPYSVKHEVKPLGANALPLEYHPAYLSLAEQDALWARRLENQATQYCYIKLPNAVQPRSVPWLRWPLRLLRSLVPVPARSTSDATQTIQFKTVTLPLPRCTREEVEALKQRYAAQLLTPLSALAPAEAPTPARSSSSPLSVSPASPHPHSSPVRSGRLPHPTTALTRIRPIAPFESVESIEVGGRGARPPLPLPTANLPSRRAPDRRGVAPARDT